MPCPSNGYEPRESKECHARDGLVGGVVTRAQLKLIEMIGVDVRARARVHYEAMADWNYDTTTLEASCVVASAMLCKSLRIAGFDARFVCGWFGSNDHCWVVVDDTIIDVTAEQFDRELPAVFMLGVRNNKYEADASIDGDHLAYACEWLTDEEEAALKQEGVL